jgi:hypothetical protein
MWGEGASDLWGHLEEADDEREVGLLEPLPSRLEVGAGADEEEPTPDLEAA